MTRVRGLVGREPRRPRRDGRRRELDARVHTRGREAWHSGRARRGGPALVRSHDARGDQPAGRRCAGRPGCSRHRSTQTRTSWPRESTRREFTWSATSWSTACSRASRRPDRRPILRSLDLDGRFGLVTLHRPALVDSTEVFGGVVSASARHRERAAARLSGSSAHAQAHRGERHRGRCAARAADRSPGIPRLPPARGRGLPGAHGLGRHPGGDHRPRRSVPHAPREHRAADHDHARDEPAGRSRPGRHPSCGRTCLAKPGSSLRAAPVGRSNLRTDRLDTASWDPRGMLAAPVSSSTNRTRGCRGKPLTGALLSAGRAFAASEALPIFTARSARSRSTDRTTPSWPGALSDPGSRVPSPGRPRPC